MVLLLILLDLKLEARVGIGRTRHIENVQVIDSKNIGNRQNRTFRKVSE